MRAETLARAMRAPSPCGHRVESPPLLNGSKELARLPAGFWLAGVHLDTAPVEGKNPSLRLSPRRRGERGETEQGGSVEMRPGSS
jgi:hypothetical protein